MHSGSIWTFPVVHLRKCFAWWEAYGSGCHGSLIANSYKPSPLFSLSYQPNDISYGWIFVEMMICENTFYILNIFDNLLLLYTIQISRLSPRGHLRVLTDAILGKSSNAITVSEQLSSPGPKPLAPKPKNPKPRGLGPISTKSGLNWLCCLAGKS